MADHYADSFKQDGFPMGFLTAGIGPVFLHVIHGRFALVAADVAINEKLYLCRLPSDVRVMHNSTVYFSALGAGAGDVDIGDDENPDGLADGLNMTNAGSASMTAAVALADRGKMLWEVLGYETDPGGELAIYATFKAEPAANGNIYFELIYAHA